METLCQYGYDHKGNLFRLGVAGLSFALALCARIAVIPQTEGSHWDPTHTGAEAAAGRTGAFIYWNAPTRADDVEAQIALVERVVDDNYQGLVLAPIQPLSLISPVRHALARGIPTVIIGTPLYIPPGGNLFYLLNDDAEGGQIAAQRVAEQLKNHGTVAVLGINPDVTATLIRARSFEMFLAQNSPGIRIVGKRMGSFNVRHEQQAAEDVLRANPGLDAIVALTSATVTGTLYAIETAQEKHAVKVIGFDTGRMRALERKQQAIELIHARRLGQSVPAMVHLHPKLITRDNLNTPEVRQMLSLDWKFGHWRWSSTQ
jgi:ribose transport system substrate-binding protein